VRTPVFFWYFYKSNLSCDSSYHPLGRYLVYHGSFHQFRHMDWSTFQREYHLPFVTCLWNQCTDQVLRSRLLDQGRCRMFLCFEILTNIYFKN
jgi:hypothetical protein